MLPNLLLVPWARSLSTRSPWLLQGITGHGAKPTRHRSPHHPLVTTHLPLGGSSSLPGSQGFGTAPVLPAVPAHLTVATMSPPGAATSSSL